LRLGKAKEPVVHTTRPKITQYPAIVPIREGGPHAVLACGSVAELGKNAAAMTGSALYSAALWSMDKATEQAIVELVETYERIVVVEEHLRAGGFGSFVRECLESRPDLQARIRCLSVDEKVCGMVGSQAYLRAKGGLTTEAILKSLLSGEKPISLARDAA
jgi:transketolase C-terminal domain/subunit